MSFFVYILESQSTGMFYIGQANNLEQRLERHNKGYVRSTKNKGPWKVKYALPCSSRKEAMAIERKLKNMKSRQRILIWIEKQQNVSNNSQ